MPSSEGPDSRVAIREFIKAGLHPDSRTETMPTVRPQLRLGDPFPFVIAVIPAYNEEESILNTIQSLRFQTRRADEIIVLADNCTDGTVSLALAAGVSVVESKGNADGKAGALNALMKEILPLLENDDSLLVMDADTELSPQFIESTVNMLFSKSRKPIAGVGGIFLADHSTSGLVHQLQSNEYVRYQRRLSRRQGRALVLTGTGTVFRAGVLREVQAARRSGRLPDLGKSEGVYDTSALTEDNELTISVKELGYRVVSPKQCTVKTAMMPNWRSLFKQRRRWQRGALENLIAHGVNLHTLPYMLRQTLTYLGVLFLPFYVYTLVFALATGSEVNFFEPLWMWVAGIYVFEQTFSVRRGGAKAIWLSLAIIPEVFLNMFLDVIYLVSLWGALFATDEAWGRMRHLQSDEFDKRGRPRRQGLTTLNLTLHGTHRLRQNLSSRIAQIFLFLAALIPVSVMALLPILDLQMSWNVIAGYVLIGFLATLGRLIPVKTF